ncbi:MAG TPA: hypothetical protein VKU80_07930, partial [Planctomycetota bacterium]|nr:hypothetical protein [Planctomycetota bacterium]
TSAAGRIELAEALLQLNDAMSWRAGLHSIAVDGKASLNHRLGATRVLLEAGDPGVPGILRSLIKGLPDLSEPQQRDVVEFLLAMDTPLSRDLLARVASDDRLPEAVRRLTRPPSPARATPEEPARPLLEGRSRRGTPPLGRSIVKKRETGEETFITIPTILAAGVTVVLLVLLLVENLRKG